MTLFYIMHFLMLFPKQSKVQSVQKPSLRASVWIIPLSQMMYWSMLMHKLSRAVMYGRLVLISFARNDIQRKYYLPYAVLVCGAWGCLLKISAKNLTGDAEELHRNHIIPTPSCA